MNASMLLSRRRDRSRQKSGMSRQTTQSETFDLMQRAFINFVLIVDMTKNPRTRIHLQSGKYAYGIVIGENSLMAAIS